MRVLIVCDWFLKYAVHQAIGLRAAGADVALLCRDHCLEFGSSVEERNQALTAASASGVEVLVVKGRISDVGWISRAPRFRGAVRRWRPDVVHVHENADPRLLLVCRGYPTVLTVHDPVPHPGAPRRGVAKRIVLRLWLRRATAVVVHGPELREEIYGIARVRRVAVIEHGAAPRREPLAPPRDRAVLFFGRLQPYKGLETLLGAMQRVWQLRSDVNLLVAGEGPEADILPADPRIHASVGYVPESRLDVVFSSASIVVLPYIQASQSGVGLLALARGVPLIVSRTGSLPDLALDDSYIVDPGDQEQLAKAILRHIDDGPAVREAALRRARERFSWETIGRAALQLYEDILAA